MSRAQDPGTQSPEGYVYLIHFQSPYRHARHYLGWTLDIQRRLAQHRAGQGSPLLRAAGAAGIDFDVVRTWHGDRQLERKLHNYKNTPARLCPLCRGETSVPSSHPVLAPRIAAS